MTDSQDLILSNNLFFLTAAFSRMLSREADEAFASVGLSSSHVLILYLVDGNPDIQPGSLAKLLYLKPSTITRLVQKLERRGLVERKSEGRATSIVCTSEGSRLANDIENQWQKLIDQKTDQLGDRYVEVLSEMISNAIDTLGSDS
jgi:DNA-binding MarR family transcriptional regulator